MWGNLVGFLGLCDFGRALWCSLTVMMQRDDLLNKKRTANDTSHRNALPYHSHRRAFHIFYTHRMHTQHRLFFSLSLRLLSTFWLRYVCCHNVGFTRCIYIYTRALTNWQIAPGYIYRIAANCWFHSCNALESVWISLALISIRSTAKRTKINFNAIWN